MDASGQGATGPRGMVSFWNAANAVTLSGLVAGLAAALLAVAGRLHFAAAALVAAGIADLFDGFIARRLPLEPEARRFGGSLDSLADICSFGFAPAVFLFCQGLTSPAELGALFLYLGAAAWRLAYFDTVGLLHTGARSHYRGLPVTYAALFLPVAAVATTLLPETRRTLFVALTLALAFLMLSPWSFPKPRGLWYAFFALLALALGGTLVALGCRN